MNDNNNKTCKSSQVTLEWESIDTLLTSETKLNKLESWSKLNKTLKLKLLSDYALIIAKEKELCKSETNGLIQYLLKLLENKRLNSVKDVIYDKENGKITNIPMLVFNETNRKFTLNRSDKRNSTLKSLGRTRKHSKKIDEHIKDINI